jgi:hypothetical protein
MRIQQEQGSVLVSVDVENVGEMEGAEVVQLYVSPKNPSVNRPLRELKAFQKVFVKVGETVTVKMRLDGDAFTYYDEKSHSWYSEKDVVSLQICKDANTVLLYSDLMVR